MKTEEKRKKTKEDKEKEIVDLVLTRYKKSYESKSKLHTKWEQNVKAYSGELFTNSTTSENVNAVSNYIFGVVETIKPILLSNYPTINLIPKSFNSFGKAKLTQQVLEYEWKRTDMFSKLHQTIHNSLVYGTSVVGVFWNPKLKNGLGDVEVKVIPPFNFFVNDEANTIQDAEYCLYATYKPVKEVIHVYPDKKEKLLEQTTGSKDKFLNFGKKVEVDETNKSVLYIEAYMKDYETIEVEDEETGETIEQLKYPSGRKVVVAGDVLLSDEENPYARFPFASLNCYKNGTSFWGISEVEQLVAPQKYMTKLNNAIIENALLNGNPWTIIEKNTGVNPNSLSNKAGLVLKVNPGTAQGVHRVAPAPLPGYLANMIDVLKYDVQEISGVFSTTKGDRAAGVTSYSAIEALSEKSQGRIKLKAQLLEMLISNIGEIWLSIIREFWESKREIRITGGMEIPSDLDVFFSQELQLDAETIIQFALVDKDTIDGDYDITVFSGSTMYTNKASRAQQLLQLSQTMGEDGMPMITRKALLQSLELENVSDILIEFEQMKQVQMQNQQAQSEANMQSAQMANEGKMQVEQMKGQAKLQEAQMRSETAIQTQQLRNQAKLEEMTRKDYFDKENKEIDSQNAIKNTMVNKTADTVLNQMANQQLPKEEEVLQKNENVVKLNSKESNGEEVTMSEEEMMELANLPMDQLIEVVKANPELLKAIMG